MFDRILIDPQLFCDLLRIEWNAIAEVHKFGASSHTVQKIDLK